LWIKLTPSTAAKFTTNHYTSYYGCTKCQSGKTTNPTSGPYRPGSLQPGALSRCAFARGEKGGLGWVENDMHRSFYPSLTQFAPPSSLITTTNNKKPQLDQHGLRLERTGVLWNLLSFQ
jgi:hypothetical protein